MRSLAYDFSVSRADPINLRVKLPTSKGRHESLGLDVTTKQNYNEIVMEFEWEKRRKTCGNTASHSTLHYGYF